MKLIFAAGGSGGHIEPALATAAAVKDREPGAEIVFVSSKRGVGQEVIESRGFKARLIEAVPAPRGFGPATFSAPGQVLSAVTEVAQVIAEEHPDAVVGFGGYVAAPAYLAAKRAHVPVVLHEANAKAGWANRLGAKLTRYRAENYPGSLPNAEVVGMPIKRSLVELDRHDLRAEARRHFGFESDRLTLLVTGGSQGARKLNQVAIESLDQLHEMGVDVLHVLGEANLAEAPAATAHYRPVGFVSNMGLAYASADLICCRAGANTVAEVSLVGLPALFVPLPIGNGEQKLNALRLVEARLAWQVDNDELDVRSLVAWVRQLLGEPDKLARVSRDLQDSVIRDGAERLTHLIFTAAKAAAA